jgi:hypothetical protein
MSGDQRFELIREIATLAEARREPLIYIRAAPDYAMGLLERGLRTEADTCLATLAERCAAHDSASTRWRLPVLRAAFALFDGDADGSERFCDEALAIAAGAGTTPVPMLWSGNRIAVAIASGDPARIRRHAELVLARMPRHTWVTPFRSWVLAAMGRRDEAAALLEQLIAAPYGFQGRLITAEACKILGHREAAGPLYRQTMGHCAGVHFGWSALGVAFMFGPAPRLLGELALLAGDAAGARRHFEESVALCRRIGARPFLERSLAALEGLDQLDANVAAR